MAGTNDSSVARGLRLLDGGEPLALEQNLRNKARKRNQQQNQSKNRHKPFTACARTKSAVNVRRVGGTCEREGF
eukprot:6205380-Pleurochrysis_carterae.AAC.6